MWIGIYKPYSGGPISTTVYVGDTSNANMTLGLTINQGAADNEILALKSSDVAHTVTTDTEADTYALMKKYSATAGGVLFRGLTDADAEGAMVLEGIIGSTNPTDTNAALLLIGSKQSGNTTAALGAAETVLKILNRTTELIDIMGDGDVLFGSRLTIGGGTNDDGIVFGNLGTATRGIDLSESGLSGTGDYWLYMMANTWLDASGNLKISDSITTAYFTSYVDDPTYGYLSNASVPLRISAGTNANIISELRSDSVFLAGNKTKVASLTSVTVSGSDLQHADIDTATAVGELVHIISGTGVTPGIYRITVVGVNSVTVDRAPGGTGTNIVLSIYKDVISMHATDATNGQMLTSWSAQNKPLQLGGTVLAATSGLTSKDVFIGAELGLGGTVNTTTTNAYVVGGGQTATTKNTGWMKVYISGTDVAWIPYWTNATP